MSLAARREPLERERRDALTAGARDLLGKLERYQRRKGIVALSMLILGSWQGASATTGRRRVRELVAAGFLWRVYRGGKGQRCLFYLHTTGAGRAGDGLGLYEHPRTFDQIAGESAEAVEEARQACAAFAVDNGIAPRQPAETIQESADPSSLYPAKFGSLKGSRSLTRTNPTESEARDAGAGVDLEAQSPDPVVVLPEVAATVEAERTIPPCPPAGGGGDDPAPASANGAREPSAAAALVTLCPSPSPNPSGGGASGKSNNRTARGAGKRAQRVPPALLRLAWGVWLACYALRYPDRKYPRTELDGPAMIDAAAQFAHLPPARFARAFEYECRRYLGDNGIAGELRRKCHPFALFLLAYGGGYGAPPVVANDCDTGPEAPIADRKTLKNSSFSSAKNELEAAKKFERDAPAAGPGRLDAWLQAFTPRRDL